MLAAPFVPRALLLEGLASTGLALPRGLWLTAAVLVAVAAAVGGARSLRAPLARPFGQLALLLALGAAGTAAWTALAPERRPELPLALAALAAGLAHAAVFRHLPQRALGRFGRRTSVRLGTWAGFVSALALLRPVPWAIALAAGFDLVLAWRWSVALARGAAPRDGSVRFACPRCGTLGDWPAGVTPCTDCGLFVHLFHEPEDLPEPARLAPEDPRPGEVVRFTCPACRHAGDWSRGHAACAHCGRRVRVHWNEHA